MLTVCHRRFGKTVYGINKLLKACATLKRERPRYAYIAPLRVQAKSIAWDYLKYYSRPIPGIQVYESELRVDYPNGGRITLYGSDNPDALRGIYLDGCILDEYAQIHPRLFSEIIRPTLSDRQGWAEFQGTPAGRNHFHELYQEIRDDQNWGIHVFKASETGIIAADELADARRQMSDEEYAQEYECSWTAAIRGAYYADLIEKARQDKRITRVPVESGYPVNTYWDLGVDDTCAVWFHQLIGREHRFVDYYENSNEGLEHYVNVLRGKGFAYGDHYLPHDVEIREITSGIGRKQALENMGLKPVKVVSRIRNVAEGIQMVRQKLPSCVFDAERCKVGLQALESYRREYDEKHKVYRNHPLHDWASHGADAFRQFAQGFIPVTVKRKKIDYSQRLAFVR